MLIKIRIQLNTVTVMISFVYITSLKFNRYENVDKEVVLCFASQLKVCNVWF